MRKFAFLATLLIIFFGNTGNVSAADNTPLCAMGPQYGFDYCTRYTLPGAIGVPSSQCTNPAPEVQANPGDSFEICCQTPDAACSVYQLRNPMCGSSDLAQRMECGYDTEKGLLMCWGNNYRNPDQEMCSTDPDFPAPNEGGEKRSAYLVNDDNIPDTTLDPEAAKGQFDSILYNGVQYNNIPEGRVCFCDPALQGGCLCPGFETAVDGEGESRLWFPHLRLIAALSSMAQAIFAPHPTTLEKIRPSSTKGATLKNEALVTNRIEKHQGVDDNTVVVNTSTNNSSLITRRTTPDADQLLSFTQDPYTDVMCTVPEVINNRGDDLLGPEITGRLLFTQQYSYEACPSENCVADGTEGVVNPATCCSGNSGGRPECYAEPLFNPETKTYTCGTLDPVTFPTQGRAAVFVKNPMIEYIYDTVVVGTQSLFKKFMPQDRTQDFEEIPSSVAYTGNAIANNQKGSSVALVAGEGGSTPLFYVPHIGSLKKYWLQDLQKALRPRGVSGAPIGKQASPSAAPTGTCIAPDPFSSELSKVIDVAIANGGAASRVPKSLLEAVYSIEGFTAFTKPGDTYTCEKNFANALGLMQITDSALNLVTDPSEVADNEVGNCSEVPGKLNRCNPVDAMELAARVLLLKVGKLQSGSITGKDDVYRAAYGYYGCYDPDSMTIDRGNDDWGSGRQGPAIDNQDGKTNYSEVVCSRSGHCSQQSHYPWPRPVDTCGTDTPGI